MKRFIIASICAMAALLCGNPAFSAGVPPTGQTKCYNNTALIDCPAEGQEFYGQDACYSSKYDPTLYDPTLRFQIVVEGKAVKDKATGLIWEIKTSTETDLSKSCKYLKDDAAIYVNGLKSSGFAGITDWRLPTVNELSSIANLGANNPAIYTQLSPVNIYYGYWTDVTYKGLYGDTWWWTINFYRGEVRTAEKTSTRCVRAVSGSYTTTGLGLVWQKTPAVIIKTWQEALVYCKDLPPVQIGSKSYNWRLPNREELLSIVNYEKYNPAISSDFTAVSGKYWSSTTDDKAPNQAWTIDFTDGTVSPDSKALSYYVQAVRDADANEPAYSRGDINHDTKVDLADAIDGLRVLDGISVTVYTDTEVNGDGKIGHEEVIYALQVTAGLRTQ